jgi:hypothetical protein
VGVAGLAAVPVLFSPLIRMRDLPDELDATTPDPVASETAG